MTVSIGQRVTSPARTWDRRPGRVIAIQPRPGPTPGSVRLMASVDWPTGESTWEDAATLEVVERDDEMAEQVRQLRAHARVRL